jgi:hypothetical protein
MQTTILMLLTLLAAQLGDLDDRYPDPSATPAEAGQADTASTPGTDPTDSPATSTQAATDPTTTEEPAAPPSNVFDEIDAAEPLSRATDDAATSNNQAGGTPPSSFDLSTRPSFSAQPPAASETAAPETETDPAKVLAGMLEAPLEGGLTGTKLSLAQAVDNSVSRPDQTQRVVAYWDLSQAMANYYLAYKERTELAALRQGISLPASDWETARQTTEARLELARDRVRVAQEYLAALMGNTTPGFAALPSDVPFCGPYETRYAQLFQSRSSALAEQLNELLPRLHSDLSGRTADIASARKWMFTVSDRRGLQSDGNELLKAFELFATRRRLFIIAVREYNLGVVRYTEIATPGTVETERLVAMLIRTGSSPGTTLDRDIQPANAEEGAGLNDSSNTTPISGWNSAPQSSTERSILVPKG